MIITGVAMYLNTVYGASFDYLTTFIGDMILCGIVSASINIKNIAKKKE